MITFAVVTVTFLPSFFVSFKTYSQTRIEKRTDWIKQPFLDVTRCLNHQVFKVLKEKFRAKPAPEIPRRLLLIRRNNLGDAICSLPLIQSLKLKNPSMIIDVIANPYNAEIFRRCKAVSRVIEIPERWLGNRYGVLFHPLVRQIRKGIPYDLLLNASASYSSKAAYLALICPAKFKLGIASQGGAIWDYVWDRHITAASLRSMHMVERLAELCTHAAIPLDEQPPPQLNVSNYKKPGEPILLCPIVWRQVSRWPDDSWSALASILSSQGRVIHWLSHRPLGHESDLLISPHDVSTLIDELASYRAIICSEGGLSHLGPAVGVFSVVLSGKEIKDSWCPWSDLAVLIEKPGAVENITPEQIIVELKSMIECNLNKG